VFWIDSETWTNIFRNGLGNCIILLKHQNNWNCVFFHDIGSIPVLEEGVYRNEDESYLEEYFPLGCDGM
jgi:hypothetical protein